MNSSAIKTITSEEEVRQFVEERLGASFVVRVSRFTKLPHGMSRVKYRISSDKSSRIASLLIDNFFSLENRKDFQDLMHVIHELKCSKCSERRLI